MRVVGLMSGTSYDAIDVAAADLALDGTELRMVPLGALEDPHPLRDQVATLLPPSTATVEQVCQLDTRLGQAFAEAAAHGVDELCGGRADLVVSHGQTVYHWVSDGQVHGTLQLGQPAWVAERTGLPVVSDLRVRDVARGGQGAPLVSLVDVLLMPPGMRTRAALNLGGIANLTLVPPVTARQSAVLAYDVGPAGALLDAAARELCGEPCDADGVRAARGRVHAELLAALLDEPFYALPPPKSTGKERFHWTYLRRLLDRARGGLDGLDPMPGPDDVLATLTELTARLVAAECVDHDVSELLVSGGGMRNPTLMARIRALAPCPLRPVDDLGISSAAKEAYAFAVLGFLTVHGLPGTLPSCTGAREAAVLGTLTPGARPLRLPEPAPVSPRRITLDRPT